MPKLNYECKACQKEFDVSYTLFKPGTVTCPHCGSDNVAEQKKAQSCGCGSKSDNKGFRFT